MMKARAVVPKSEPIGGPEGSPWPYETQERGDVLHRFRNLLPALKGWRNDVARAIATDAKVPVEKARELLDEGLSRTREVTRILFLLYGRESTSPNPSDARRVDSRLNLFRELPPKSAGVEFPAPLRGELSGLLARHASAVCHTSEPECESCELKKLCGAYRARASADAAQSGAPTFVDFFAGAGGLSEGFRRAGFRSLGAFDIDPLAMRTYRLNHPETPDQNVSATDIAEVTPEVVLRLGGGRKPDVILGAPPCQGFSRAGMRSKVSLTGYRPNQDARNFLFEHLIALTVRLKPSLFLMENVPGIESARRHDETFLEAAEGMLKDAGYTSARWRLYAPAFGVPQERLRTFLVAWRGKASPSQPSEDYQNIRRGDFDPDALPPIGTSEAIFDLPGRTAGTGTGVDLWERGVPSTDMRMRRFLKKFRLTTSSRLIWNHFVRYHNERDLELYALLKPGEDSVHAIERYGRADLMRYRRDVFDDKYARLRPDRPSKTIVSHLAKDGNGYIHPFQTRSISIREAARLQTFSDDYVFCGSPSDQWVQIGNAVPPVLGEAIARRFDAALKEVKQ